MGHIVYHNHRRIALSLFLLGLGHDCSHSHVGDRAQAILMAQQWLAANPKDKRVRGVLKIWTNGADDAAQCLTLKTGLKLRPATGPPAIVVCVCVCVCVG